MTEQNVAEERLLELVRTMRQVFHHDWELTRDRLSAGQVDDFISPGGGTFLHPLVIDEADNWGNRAGLLEAYRRARELLRARGLDPDAL